MAVQLNFTLRTSATCKTVHLLGNWDNYTGQLPLSRDPTKAGGWKGCFRFQGKTLKPGQRYWYYYIIDGYHVSHDPARESVVEPTTKRRLNILDIPGAAKPAPDINTGPTSRSSQHARRSSQARIPKGRSLSPSKIQSPQPTKPHATLQITSETYSHATVDALTAKFSRLPLHSDSDSDDTGESDSEFDSDVPSLTGSSRSSNNSSPSSVSSVSSTASACSCERYGITRRGDRVKLDCGGARCGYSDGEECSDGEEERRRFADRRHGLVVH